MKNNKNPNKGICICLGAIAFLLLCGVILFAAYIYKFDPLSLFAALFQTDANVVWSAINAVATAGVGIATVVVSTKLAKLQEGQAHIEKQQHLLQTEPHILIDSLDVCISEFELTVDQKKLKTIKGIDYPYYTNTLEDGLLTNFSIITVTIINTSEAFARLRFNEAIIKQNDENIIAKYNISTLGVHKSHIMIKRGGSGKIGLLIGNDLLNKLNGTQFTFSTYLDNNFNECFLDEQSYHISYVCEESVTFMPLSIKRNTFKKVE